jgi:hypothetical protein
MREGAGAGATINNITINNRSADPQETVATIRRYNRTAGPAPVDIGFY